MAFHCDYSKFKSFVVFSQVKEGCKVLQLIILVEDAITIIVGVFVIFQAIVIVVLITVKDAITVVVVVLCICFAVPIEILILICILDTITVGIIVSPPSRNKRPRDEEDAEV